MWKSRSVAIFSVLLMVLSILSGLGASTASASKSAKVVVATGSITCRKVAGTITLSPPDRKGGTQPETMVWKITASGCTTIKSNVKHVTSGTVKAVVHEATNACGGLVYSRSLHATIVWSPKSVHSTSGTFSGFTFVRNKLGEEGFTMPNTGGTASVKGSFAGKDHGARTVITLYSNLTLAKFATACESKAGLAGYKIIGGAESSS
jgi:hypothetical protein